MNARPFIISRKWITSADAIALELVPADGAPLPPAQPGAHVEFLIERPGQPPLVRHYSVCNAPGESGVYVFGVKREPQSRGGSAWIHSRNEGDVIRLGAMRNHFSLASGASSHLLLAGGIGVTPLLAMAQALGAVAAEYRLHYFVRGEDHVAFRDRLGGAAMAGRLHIHAGLDVQQVNTVLRQVLEAPEAGAHAYCCGPGPFMDSVAMIAGEIWPEDCLHFERFQATPASSSQQDSSFVVMLQRMGISCTVEPGQSIVQALEAVGCPIGTSCEQGVCGTCITQILDGEPDHRDAFLSKAERERGKCLLPCVSRSHSPVLVLDL